MANTHWPAAFECPQCSRKSGRALKLASQTAGKILVSLRCRDCAHEWSIEGDTPTFAIRRQRDRRRQPRDTVSPPGKLPEGTPVLFLRIPVSKLSLS